MAKISTYSVVPSPADLMDMVIGTNVNNNNETENFELSQILSLYPQITQKATLLSSVDQSAPINTPTIVTFNTINIATTGLTALPSGGPTYTGVQIGNGGYYLVEFTATVLCAGAGGEFSAWAKINSSNIGPAHVLTPLGGGYNTVTFSWIYNFTAADILSIAWQTSVLNISLDSIAAGVARPIVPSAQLIISQV